MAYIQANVLSAYVFLAPAIVAGIVTLGVMQQIIRAFGKVEGSMQFLLKSWPTIIELASIYKRLREFEKQIILNGGEDYELVLALPKKWAEALTKNLKSAHIIGFIKEGKPNISWDNLEPINNDQSSSFKHFEDKT